MRVYVRRRFWSPSAFGQQIPARSPRPTRRIMSQSPERRTQMIQS